MPSVAIGLARRPSQMASACVPGTPNTALRAERLERADQHVGRRGRRPACGGRRAHWPSSASAAAAARASAASVAAADAELLADEGVDALAHPLRGGPRVAEQELEAEPVDERDQALGDLVGLGHRRELARLGAAPHRLVEVARASASRAPRRRAGGSAPAARAPTARSRGRTRRAAGRARAPRPRAPGRAARARCSAAAESSSSRSKSRALAHLSAAISTSSLTSK